MIHIYQASKPDDKAHRKDDLTHMNSFIPATITTFFGRKFSASCLEVNIRSRFQHCPLLKYILKISFYLVRLLSSLVELNLRPSESMPHPVLSQLENTFPE